MIKEVVNIITYYIDNVNIFNYNENKWRDNNGKRSGNPLPKMQ